MLGQIAAADEVVRRHQVERLAADDPHTAQLAAAEQHQAETVIVGKRRNEPAAARMETAILRPPASSAAFDTLSLRQHGRSVCRERWCYALSISEVSFSI